MPHWQSESLAVDFRKTEVAQAGCKCCEAMSCLQVPSVVIPYQGGIMTSCTTDEAVASQLAGSTTFWGTRRRSRRAATLDRLIRRYACDLERVKALLAMRCS